MDSIEQAAEIIKKAFRDGHMLFLFGNGGSAADAQHIAAEFIGHNPPLAALALTTDTSVITATGNDFGFEHIFERQIRALCKKEDVIIAISTSGESENVLAGVFEAKKIGAFCIGLTGKGWSRLQDRVDLCIHTSSKNTQKIQEEHIRIGHKLAGFTQ